MLSTLPEFHLYLRKRGYGSKEIRQFKGDIFLLSRWAEDKKLGHSLSHEMVKLYTNMCQMRKSPAEVKVKRESIAIYLYFLYREGFVDPAWYFRRRDSLTLLPRWLTAYEQNLLLTEINHLALQNALSAALIGILFTTGLWTTKISVLRMKDVHLSERALRIEGISLTFRHIHPLVYPILRQYFVERQSCAAKFAFENDEGKPVSPDFIRGEVARVSRQAGLRGVTVRILQHTCAKNIRDNEGPTRAFIYLRHTKSRRYAYAKPNVEQIFLSNTDLFQVSPHSAPREHP